MNASRPRVLLLGGEGPSTNVVANALRASVDLLAAVIEPRPSRIALVRGRIKRLGLIPVVDQLLFQTVASPLVQRESRARIRAIQANAKLDVSTPSVTRHSVDNVNGPAALGWIRQYKPDLIVINGTRILSAETLRAIPVPVLNLHAGITPSYRGVHGGYWSLVAHDAAHFGATVHRVDEGIDTGHVLAYAYAQPTLQDTFATYPWLQLAAGLPCLLNAVQTVLERPSSVDPVPVQPPLQPLRYHPGIRTYLWNRWMWGIR